MNFFLQIPIQNLHPGRFQPRKQFNQDRLQELAESIKAQGLIEPLVVRHLALERYEIIAGERRWRAAQLLGLETIACIIGTYSDEQAAAVTLIENIQREDLNLIEEASGYQRLALEFKFTQEEIATLVGKSRSHIANLLRLLTLCHAVQAYICDGRLSLGHARMLVGLSPERQMQLALQVIEKNWSVRRLEDAVRLTKQTEYSQQKSQCDIQRLQTVLSEQIGAPVNIVTDSETGGWLNIKFFDHDTLSGLLERMGLRYD